MATEEQRDATNPAALDDLRTTLGEVGLDVPPIPGPLVPRLKKIGTWCWSTWEACAVDLYFFDEPVAAVLRGERPDSVALAHWGHGLNSYALTYQVDFAGLAVVMQVGWGGVYGDPEEKAAFWNRRVAAIEDLLTAYRGSVEALSPGRFVVIESSLRARSAFGVVPAEGTEPREWLETHGGRGMETLEVAAEWLRER